jgi:hypothetical protein
MFKSTMLPQADAKAPFGIRLRQQYQLLTLAALIEKKFEKGLLKTKETVISAKSQAFQIHLS